MSYEDALTHYHTIPSFDAPEKEAFRKHCGKRRKCWRPAFSPFPTMFSTLHKTNFKLSFTFILSSANAFNLDQSKILSFGNGLNQYHTIPTLMTLGEKPFEKIVGKGENAGSQHFLLFPQCFLPFPKEISIL